MILGKLVSVEEVMVRRKKEEVECDEKNRGIKKCLKEGANGKWMEKSKTEYS